MFQVIETYPNSSPDDLVSDNIDSNNLDSSNFSTGNMNTNNWNSGPNRVSHESTAISEMTADISLFYRVVHDGSESRVLTSSTACCVAVAIIVGLW